MYYDFYYFNFQAMNISRAETGLFIALFPSNQHGGHELSKNI